MLRLGRSRWCTLRLHANELLLTRRLVILADSASQFLSPAKGDNRNEAEGKEVPTLNRDNRGIVTPRTDNANMFKSLESSGEVLGSTGKEEEHGCGPGTGV
jgi:hypothetical protein